MKILSKIPENSKLQFDISHLYYMNCENENIEYSIYPSNVTVLMIYQNADLKFTKENIYIKGNNKNSLRTIIVGPFNKFRIVNYSGFVKMFGIVFKENSIYNFSNFNEYYLNEKTITNNITFSGLVNEEDFFVEKPKETIVKIEENLLRQRTPIKDGVLEKCIRLISSDSNITLSQLSDKTYSSKKAIINKFKKYIGRTPSNFIRVKKFRRSLNLNPNSLTSLAYELGFCDQSHMIKNFKKLTGETPGRIQKKKNISGFNQLKWLK